MLKNYFKIAIRNIKRDKVSATINILGLSLGLASSLLILLFVYNDLNVDQSFEHGDRIYRVTNDERSFRESGRYLATTGPPFAPALAAELPEVESAVRLRYTDDVVFEYENNQMYEDKVIYASEDFFKLFTFPLAKGNQDQALSEPNSIVLTAQMAQKYFGDEDPLGKELLMNDEIALKVTGILENKLQNTHLDFDFLISFNTFKVPFGYPVTLDSWGWISFHSYVLLKDGVQPSTVNDKLVGFVKQHVYGDRPIGSKYELQALSDVYFHSDDMMNSGEYKKGNLTYTYGLSFIAFLILLVAGFNFMNINTARSVKRAKEVGVRKVLGAGKGSLISQFLGEAVVNSVISLGLALILFELSKDTLIQYLGWNLELNYGDYLILFPIILGVTLLLSVLSSIYPAFILSGFKPVSVFKGKVRFNNSGMNIRKVLVVCQFAITVGLIVCSLVVSQQMNFIRNKNLGYDKEQLVSLQMRTDDFLQRYSIAQKVLLQNPNVLGITAGDVMDGDYGSVPMTPAGTEQGIAMHMIGGYLDYFTTFGIEFAEGRDFSAQHPRDTATGVIINEAAQRTFGWDNPIGQALQVNSNINGEVIGVVKDFHFQSLHDPIEPLVVVVPRTHMRNIILRVNPTDNIDGLIASLQTDWQQIAPDLPFQFSFVDDQLNLEYNADLQFSKLVTFFGWIAIFIASLGLYGLIAIITAYKIKEIGIRKTLGASVSNILIMLSRNFLTLILIANLIALPIAWWFMKNWLQNFSYHTDISVPLLVTAILISLIIAISALSYQVIKSALGNPVQALREE